MFGINPSENWVEREERDLRINNETKRIIDRNKYVQRVINGIFPGVFKEVEFSDAENHNLLLEKLECEADYDSNNQDTEDDGKLEWGDYIFSDSVSNKEVE